jgi:putative tryptophan/tyrosine transport system substrate-binding protein
MRKGSFVLALSLVVALLLAFCVSAQAQQPKTIPRIGYVSATGDAKNPGPQVEAFRQGLRELGYFQTNNILVEYRYIEGRSDTTSSLVAELVQLKVDVLVLGSQPAIRAAKHATKTIPIVMVTTQDPVAAGFVNSLARPGGNVTGLTRLTRELSGKRLELLKEAVPRIARVAALMGAAQTRDDFKWYEAPARALKIELQVLELRAPNPDIDAVFQAASRGRASALITVSGSLINRYAKRIMDLAVKNRLPSMHERSDYVDAGGLMSYAAEDDEQYRRVAYYVDRILKGTKPADLPVEQPTKFEFVINLKTAKQIGLTIPPNVLARADRVIK